MAETDFMQQLADSVEDLITTCAGDLLKVYPSTSGPKLRSQEEIDELVSSMQADIQGLVERYIGEMISKGMTSPGIIRERGEELRMINERMVLDLHAQLRSKLGNGLWPPVETT